MTRQRRYAIQIHPKAAAELAALPKRVQRQIDRKIQSLALDPRPPGSVQLKDPQFGGLRRIRIGDYRVIYDVRDAVLIVLAVRIRDRKDVYRGR